MLNRSGPITMGKRQQEGCYILHNGAKHIMIFQVFVNNN